MGPYLETAEMFRLLAHPARLQILDELRRAEACVCHLQTVLKRPQAYVSQQLRLLRDAGLVEDHRDGTNVFYRLIDPTAERLLEESLGPIGEPTRLKTCPCPYCQVEFAPQPAAAAPATG
jgi:DNA-binding transcriptional ArsR family regulator